MEIRGNLISVKESEFKKGSSKGANPATKDCPIQTYMKGGRILNDNVNGRLYKDVLLSINKEVKEDGKNHMNEEKKKTIKGEVCKE